MAMNYWLMKSEPDVFSIDDLEKVRTEPWEGIRNYQARNFIRDDMEEGDLFLFYHSNATPPGVVGVGRIVSDAKPDPHAFDPKSPYYDPKSDPENPRWLLRDVEFVCRFEEIVPLQLLKENPKLEDMLVIRRGQRLSIQPVEAAHFREVCRMGGGNTPLT